jgi:hypothetical protein
MTSESWARVHDEGRYFRKLSANRWLVANLIVFVFMFSGLKLNAFSDSAAPMWFASGAATAFIFMRGISILTGIGLGSYFAYYSAGADAFTASGAASVWCLQSYMLFSLSLRYISPSLVYKRRSQHLAFILLSSIITAVSSWLLMMLCCKQSLITFYFWLSWWLANLNGVLVFASSVYTWDYYFPEIRGLNKAVIMNLGMRFTLLLLAAILLLCVRDPYSILFSSVLVVVLIASNKYHYGWCGGMAGLFVLSMSLVFANLVDVSAAYLAVLLFMLVLVMAVVPAV